MSYPIIALSGFLGLPLDFLALKLPLWAPNLWLSEPGPLKNWAERFNRGVNQSRIIMGYSMGGRLALHALLHSPQKYRAAIIIAAHPGLATHRDRAMRIEHDNAWAERFKTMPWIELIKQWEQSPALRSSIALSRYEDDYSRIALARTLRYFSLGKQAYLIPAINQLSLAILWINPKSESGPLTKLQLKHQHSKLILIPNSNHRLMFEQADLVAKTIRRFLSSLE